MPTRLVLTECYHQWDDDDSQGLWGGWKPKQIFGNEATTALIFGSLFHQRKLKQKAILQT